MDSQQLSIKDALHLAKKHAKAGNHRSARDIYQRILAVHPNHTGAKRGLKKLPADIPSGDSFKADMANLTDMYARGELESALRLANTLCRKHKTQPMPFSLKGAILTHMDKQSEAIKAYKKAIKIDENYLDPWINLGMAQMLNNQMDEAFVTYLHVIKKSPDNIPALINLGRIYSTRGQYKAAQNCYERALTQSPKAVEALAGLGAVLCQLGKEKRALTLLREAVDLKPDYTEARVDFGVTLRQMNLFTASLEQLSTAVELEPESSNANLQLALSLTALDRQEEAIPHYESSIAHSPGGSNPTASHLLAIARGESHELPPEGYVETLFNGYAARFDKSLVGDLQYQMPTLLGGMLQTAIGERKFNRGIDLGCGTGLAGPLLRDRVDSLVGVDLSPKMLEKASERNLYDELVVSDIVNYVNEMETTADLVTCTDVLVYIGNLKPLFDAVAKKTPANAIFVITTEKLNEEKEDFRLLSTGRYTHSEDYILRVANEAGFTVKYSEEAPLRRELKAWLTGGYYFLERDST